MTVFECYNTTKQRLKAAGIEDYVFEAKQILRFVTKLTNAQIIEKYNDQIDNLTYYLLDCTVKQRCKRYPLQYILGEWEFYGLRFLVGEGCLAPRADTETLVDAANEFLSKNTTASVLDLCAGSGCIGITLAARNSDINVTLVEKYDVPYTYCTRNITAHTLKNAVAVQDDIFTYTTDKRFDLIVSNPPYISADEMCLLNEEAKGEPETALYGGEDGLDYYRLILSRYPDLLNQNGMIAVEVGFKQAAAVAELFRQAGFSDIGTKKDLNGIERVVFGTLKTV